MSSDYDYIASLTLIQTYLYRFSGPIMIGIGTVSSMVCLIVFTKKNLRKNPCSIYLIAVNISNFLLIYLSFFLYVLQIGYNINPAAYNLNFCRFTLYTTDLFDILGPFYLVLASIDRVLITSSNALIRRRSTHRFAYISIISGTLFWILFHTHAIFFADIIYYTSDVFGCAFLSGPYKIFIAYYSFLIKGILVPVLLIIFGLWSIKNIRNARRIRVKPVLSKTGTIVGDHLQSIIIILMYQQVTQYNTKSFIQNQMKNIHFVCCSFYLLYLILYWILH